MKQLKTSVQTIFNYAEQVEHMKLYTICMFYTA